MKRNFAFIALVAMLPLQVLAWNAKIPTIDGLNNNRHFTKWGSVNSNLFRLAGANYADDISKPNDSSLPNARLITSTMMIQPDVEYPNKRHLSDMVWQWGQFLDHDLSLTESGESEDYSVAVPKGDRYFDPYATGTVEIPMHRSDYNKATGTSPLNPRKNQNLVTAYIDGSQIYGSDAKRAAALRTFKDGKLKVSKGNLLPYNVDGLPNAGSDSPHMFLAGDIRANEQLGLTSMHVLFVREHNRLANQIKNYNAKFTDEEIYQKARIRIIAILQNITFNEFLPALTGKKLPTYKKYNRKLLAGISSEFSTIGFRFGHSAISGTLHRYDAKGDEISDGHLLLAEGFFQPHRLTTEGGIDPVLRGLISSHMQEIDPMAVTELTNFLFGPPGAGGLDLMALDIQRARDHGMASYNDMREAFGLKPVKNFRQITKNKVYQQQLKKLYGSVDAIDAFVGMLSEDHRHGSVGPLANAILREQFIRLRDGDRFYFEHWFSGNTLKVLKNTTLADVIERNTDVTPQGNVFKVSRNVKQVVGPLL